MSQIQDIKLIFKLNDSTKSLSLRERQPDACHEGSPNGNLNSHSYEKLDNLLKEASFIENNFPENTSDSIDNLGIISQTLDTELKDDNNPDDSVVKLHFVNPNYRSNSDASELTWYDSQTSIISNECNRRYYETKQWHSNLFFYKRSDATIDLNRRVKPKFQPLKPLIMHKSKQWYTNLFFYKRSDATIDLNRRVKLTFQPLKPFIIH